MPARFEASGPASRGAAWPSCLVLSSACRPYTARRYCGGGPTFRASSPLAPFGPTLLFFFLLRVADEFKNIEKDRQCCPERPVPRGLVSLQEPDVAGIGGWRVPPCAGDTHEAYAPSLVPDAHCWSAREADARSTIRTMRPERPDMAGVSGETSGFSERESGVRGCGLRGRFRRAAMLALTRHITAQSHATHISTPARELLCVMCRIPPTGPAFGRAAFPSVWMQFHPPGGAYAVRRI